MFLPFLEESKLNWRRFDSCWQRTREQWNDRVQARFQERYWRHFEPDVRDYHWALEKFEPTLRQAQQEVAEWYP